MNPNKNENLIWKMLPDLESKGGLNKPIKRIPFLYRNKSLDAHLLFIYIFTITYFIVRILRLLKCDNLRNDIKVNIF